MDGGPCGFEFGEQESPPGRQQGTVVNQVDPEVREGRRVGQSFDRDAEPVSLAERKGVPGCLDGSEVRETASLSTKAWLPTRLDEFITPLEKFAGSRPRIDREGLRPESVRACSLDLAPIDGDPLDGGNVRSSHAEHGLNMVQQAKWAYYFLVKNGASCPGMLRPSAGIGEP